MTNASLPQSLVPQAESTLDTKLFNARMGLLDLSARNRLLNTPRSSKNARTIEIVDEKSAEIFRLLVAEERAMTFTPGRSAKVEPTGELKPGEEEETDEITDLAQPEDDSLDERGVYKRHTDLRLQTRLTSKGLQKRLFEMHSDSVLLEQEQGVNILFLALGMLKWIDPNHAKNIRYAPLILVPVTLERGSAGDHFKLKWRHEELSSNLSLEAYLDQIHGLKMPAFESGEDCDPAAYAAAVAETVQQKDGWEVLPNDIVLGFFSFAKFLMYRDLDAECWPEHAPLTTNPLLRALLTDGFSEPPRSIDDDASVDAYIAPRDMLHVADCDSSQMLAVHEVRQGCSLVIQGPPGTGKSQTIANIIASAVADGKTVLFVAEKMVALDVVKRRLDRSGVGDACLELHSNKTNKRVLLSELKRTWELGSPRGMLPESLNQSLENERDVLNLHATSMHTRHASAQLTPFEVIGGLTELLRQGHPPVDFELPDTPLWTPEDRERRRGLLEEFAGRIGDMGLPHHHPWDGVGLTALLPTDVDRLVRRIADIQRDFDALRLELQSLSTLLHLPDPATFGGLESITQLAQRLDSAPDLGSAAFASEAWEKPSHEIDALLALGANHASLQNRLAASLRPDSMDTVVDEERLRLQSLLPPSGTASRAVWDDKAFDHLHRLYALLPELEEEGVRLQQRLGMAAEPVTIALVRRVIRTGHAVAQAPEASPEAFASAVWNHGVEQAGDLAEAAATLEQARTTVASRLLPSAWQTDLSAARRVLASHGTGVLRHLSGEWRAADRLVRASLTDPKLPLDELLPLLDVLAQGQEARGLLEREDTFGRQAFGADWRGDRSSSAALNALVSWMRSLRGLGPEARLVAARLPDRQQFGPLAGRVEKSADEFTHLYDSLPSTPLSGLPPIVEMTLGNLHDLLQPIVDAETRTRALFSHPPQDLSARLSVLAELATLQQLRAKLSDAEQFGLQLFADRWRGLNSDWVLLEAAATWLHANAELRTLASGIADAGELSEPLRRARGATTARERWVTQFVELLRDMQILPSSRLQAASAGDIPLAYLANRMQQWLDHPEQLSKWMAFRDCRQRIAGLGLDPLVERLEDGRVSAPAAGHTFAQAFHESLLRDQIRQMPLLARFDGGAHTRVVERFVELDRSRIAASAAEVVRAHHRGIPVGGGVGPIGVLRGEIVKKSRHLPIRQLMQKAAPAIQALKPVMMMSPLSVAQFLPPGKLTFDLLVMDEASQIQPVDALGAIARCRQIVVVGDERQLPPTRFFAKMTSNAEEQDEEDDDSTQVVDVESVLGLCIARGLPQRMLRWHYRSKHQSLIAVSNSEFYENKLFIIPSPFLQEAGMGLRFHHVPNGIFYSAKSNAAAATKAAGQSDLEAANPVEAKMVAEAVMRHALRSPKQSLGVATFSMAQKRAIEQQIEALRRMNPDTESFFHAHSAEPFFVKNLENVQGDERDVIMLSVGYGRDPEGRFAMRFGPLANDGGERRLNVLISRAKSCCEVYASITDEDIDTERAKSRGVFALKLFLHFARTGRLDMSKSIQHEERKSLFVAQLATALREKGYLLHEQVGIAGCFIDLAVLDPDVPSRYLLGIECDGPGYRNARSARDRDRLRRSVLEDHGWMLHRVWSLDWLHRPLEQMRSIEAAIEQAKAHLLGTLASEGTARNAARLEIVTVEREAVSEMGLKVIPASKTAGQPYIEAALPQPSELELHDTPTAILAELVERIVAIESPLHVDELVVRVRTTWGLQRTGQRIQATVDKALASALITRTIARKEDFLYAQTSQIIPRDRSNVASSSLRKPEMLPPDEVDAAVLTVIRESFGATRDELIQSCSHIFGYSATSAQLRSVFAGRMSALMQQGLIAEEGELLVVPKPVL